MESQLSGESIIIALFSEPFDAEHDMPVMFADVIRMRLAVQGNVVLILDLSEVADSPDAFSDMVFALAEASHGIRASQAAGVSGPPIAIFVGSGPIAAIAAQSLGQPQYGGASAHLCASQDEAIALARSRLLTF